MARDVEVKFSIESERANKEDLCRKLKLDSSYGFFDEYEITDDNPNHFEITAYIDEFDIDHINKFADNFNNYKAYIESISNEFLSCKISYRMDVEKSKCYEIELDDCHDDDVEIFFDISFYFDLDEVEDFDSIEFILDNIYYDSEEIDIVRDMIINTFEKAFTELDNRVYSSDTSICTQHWYYTADGSINLIDYVKELDRGIYVGDGKDLLIKLRDELNEIINSVD